MRIPDDVEELVLAFMDSDRKKGLMRMTRQEIDLLIVSEIGQALEPGYLEPAGPEAPFPYRVTPKGREILQILAPCKRSGR